MLSLKAVHDSRRTRTAALPPSTRLHYNFSRRPVAGASIASSARVTGTVALVGGTATLGRSRPQRNAAMLPAVCQWTGTKEKERTHAGMIAKDKQRDPAAVQARAGSDAGQAPSRTTEEGIQPVASSSSTTSPAKDSVAAANPPHRSLRHADSHEFDVVTLASSLDESVTFPPPSPAQDDEEWEILASHEETNWA